MEKKYNYIQIDKDKDLDDMYSIKNVSGLEIIAVPETDAFKFSTYLYKYKSIYTIIRVIIHKFYYD